MPLSRRAGIVGSGHAGKPPEQFRELIDLGLAEVLLEELSDRAHVPARGGLELVRPGVRELGVGDAEILPAERPADEARGLEPFEQAGDPGGREGEPTRKLDALEPAALRARQDVERFIPVDGESVLRLEPGVQESGRGRMGTKKPCPGANSRRNGFGNGLFRKYLRCQLLLATLVCVLNDTRHNERNQVLMTTTQTRVPAGTWKIDPVHSAVGFEVGYLAGTFRGQFGDVDVQLEVAENGAAIEGTADVASVDVKDENLAAHLQSPDFFDRERYPELRFAAREIDLDGESVVAPGEITIKGVTKPVEVTGTLSDPITDGWGNERLGLTLSATVDRTEFGLEWNMPLPTGAQALSNEVTILAELQLVKAA